MSGSPRTTTSSPGSCASRSTTAERRRAWSKGSSSTRVSRPWASSAEPSRSAAAIASSRPSRGVVWNRTATAAASAGAGSGRPSTSTEWVNTTRSSVRVPVLSRQATSIDPRSWMASGRVTSTPASRSRAVPRSSVVPTTSGSSSGASPTVTTTANSSACRTSPDTSTFTSSTSGAARSMQRTSARRTDRRPRSTSDSGRGLRPRPASSSVCVCGPVASTTAVAVPRTTVLPANSRVPAVVSGPSSPAARDGRRRGAGRGSRADGGALATGSSSPDSDDWSTSRSRACNSRASAGTGSPAASSTTSPGTRSSGGTSLSRGAVPGAGRRRTVTVVAACARSSRESRSPRTACHSRSPTPSAATTSTSVALPGLPATASSTPRTVIRPENGPASARRARTAAPGRRTASVEFSPWVCSRSAAVCSQSPRRDVSRPRSSANASASAQRRSATSPGVAGGPAGGGGGRAAAPSRPIVRSNGALRSPAPRPAPPGTVTVA